ncbi:helix-turn-helix domain-containing protein [Serratia fonticola]
MKKNINYIEEISNLLTQKGVGYRKHASTMATILGLQYNSAKQKLDGKRGITLEEVRNIFKYFNEPFEGQRVHNCVFIMNNIHKRCVIEVNDSPVINTEENETYAVKKDGLFVISTKNESPLDVEIYKVNSIDFLPAPKVAILDNDRDILELLKLVTARYGIEADTYQNKNEIIEALNNNQYEAYILDWLLDFGETSESVVKKIREKTAPYSNIIILTGQLNHYEKNIGDMILNYDVKLIEKPAKPFIISSLLLSTLFFN